MAVLLASMGASFAGDVATQSVVVDLQRAERLIAVAAKVGDVSEMKRQSRDLISLFGRIPDGEIDSARVFCTSAVQNLRNLADDLSYPGRAEKVLAAERSQIVYNQYMIKCEKEVGLPATQPPNLRTR